MTTESSSVDNAGQNIVGNYGWSSAEGPESCGYIAPAVLDLLRQLGARRVLDIGSGNGKLCSELKRAGFDVVGMEYDQQGVRISRQQNPDIHFHNCGVQDDPARLLQTEAPFDAVVSTEVIEHLFSPHQLPIFAAGVLNEHGYLILSTPYHGYLKNVAIAVLNKWDKHHTPLWHGGHIKFWSKPTLSRLLDENGFDTIDFRGVGRLPYLWKSMILVARKRSR
jgi:2-polyprenyl-3-methyl-5-hydroxy-6-metoxy-1,4-benzoquinol methylase